VERVIVQLDDTDGKHSAMILRRLVQAKLAEDRFHLPLDGSNRDDQLVGDSLVRAALRHQHEHLALARRQPIERSFVAAAADHALHNIRIQGRTTRATRRKASMNSAESSTRSLSRYPTPAARSPTRSIA
jgi:hypothetical protein